MRTIHTFFILLFLQAAMAQSDQELAAKTVEKNTIKSHISFLSDDLLEGREAGTRGNKIAASYIANQLLSFGALPVPGTDSYYQEFNLSYTIPPGFLKLDLDGNAFPLNLALELPAIETSGKAAFLGYGTEEDFKGKDLSGQVVVVWAGYEGKQDARTVITAGRDKIAIAKAMGATGLIELTQFDDAMWSRLKNYLGARTEVKDESAPEESNTFHIWSNIKDKDPGFSADRPIAYSLSSDGQAHTTQKTQNVVGIIEGTDPTLKDEYVIYSAHYDHVGIGRPNAEGDSIYNGARDNNIGVAAVLSMAENLGQYPTKRSALFILFTAEEKGLLGSSYYVEHPVVPLEQISYCFNTDGGGYNDTTLATIIGLERTTAQPLIEKGAAAFGLKATGDPAPEQGLFDRSDNVSFAQKGIPAPTYSTGFNSFDDEILKYYHQADDEAETLDYDYLLKFYRGYVYSGRLIANTPDKLFWKAGDKYEKAGKELYGID
ncbi:M28 family peptidase [Robertkochia flava]|uniref:M28 family peptidase n=1 Tax=Robertkochia flava TaxID=3447986 RepID=UPI001CCD8896|nr:M28 family peptidase [Robertkochia marina]